MGFDGSLRPKQPRSFVPPPASSTANGSQGYSRPLAPPATHRQLPAPVNRAAYPGGSSSPFSAPVNASVTPPMMVGSSAPDPFQASMNFPPPAPACPPCSYDATPAPLPVSATLEDTSNKMEVEVIKQASKKEPGLVERISAFKQNGIGFDIDFIVGPPPNPTHFKVHRVVMATGSKILEKMLFSEVDFSSPLIKKRKGSKCSTVKNDGVKIRGLQKTDQPGKPMLSVRAYCFRTDYPSDDADSNQDLIQTVDLPDVDPNAFRVIVEYLYSDFDEAAVKIPESSVLNTLYAAKKFEIKDLEKHCVELLGELTPSLAVALLEQAVDFGSDELLGRCYLVIDERSDEALASDSVASVNIETLRKLVRRSELSPSGELSVFKAVCNWADAECKRRGLDATAENKRLVVGDILSDVRFPTMTVEELGEAASSGILTDNEIGVLFRYVTSTVHMGIDLPYPTQERRILSRSRYVVRRFMNLSKNTCKKQRSTIWFIVNREILVTALGIYGLVQNETNAEGSEWEATVDIEIAASGQTKVTDSSTATLRGTYGDGRAFIAHFKKPARVVANVPHRATVMFKEEVETFAGSNGQEDVLVYVGSGGVIEQNSIGTSPSVDQSSVATFAFHNDDPNGIRRGMTRGPAVYTDAIGGFYNRPVRNSAPVYSEGCLYEGQIPEIHFIAPMEVKKEVSDV